MSLVYPWSMIFPDLPSPAEASSQTIKRARGFAQAGNRFPLFGIMLLAQVSAVAHITPTKQAAA
jgi:hypothetical protein